MSVRCASKLRHHHRDILASVTRGWLRVLVPTIAVIAIILGALVVDWFVVGVSGFPQVDKVTIDLREVRACSFTGECAAIPMSLIRGSVYPTLASITFFGSLVFAAIVLYQAASRLFAGFANETISTAGHVLGAIVILCAFGAGYLFAPDLTPGAMQGLGFDVDRDLGPSIMMIGLLLGQFGLYGTREVVASAASYKPIDPASVSPRSPGGVRLRAPTQPAPPLELARTLTPHKLSTPIPIIPDPLKGKIQFSLLTGVITPAGIDARREDGTSVLVMWRDVVGLVVRRLPPELESYPFLDIVSTSGMTLRVLPWSRLSGELADVEGADARLRALVTHVKPRCPDAALDKPTQAFTYDDTKSAAQLKNLEMLAAHDQAVK